MLGWRDVPAAASRKSDRPMGQPAARTISLVSDSRRRTRAVQDAADRLGIAGAELGPALAGAVLEPRYQPVVRMSDAACLGVEALARLRHPGQGLIPPARFIPRLEAAGLAPALTEAMAGHALEALARGACAGSSLTVALNFPLDLVLAPETPARFAARCAAAAVDPARIVVELTESRQVDDIPRLRRAVERFRDAGLVVVVDDLSPSIPCHRALLDLPFSGVKLDAGVVRRLDSAASSRFVGEVLAIAARRDLTVTAEGVEGRPVWDALRARGVQRAQGFLISRPLPARALPPWLAAWPARAARL
jgi:EAL domain-containing protein (putative c-di-GMP-specific phosphodiesterase class I)